MRAHLTGDVDEKGMAIVDAIVERRPTHGETWGETRTVVLDQKIPFEIISRGSSSR